MAMDTHTLETLIKAGIPDATITIEDLRGDGDHYAAIVTSPAFRGISRITQHRMVQQALQGRLGTTLHALQIHTRTPDQQEPQS